MFYILFYVLFLLQFMDTYCADLYDKIQSLFLKDLIMLPRNITLEKATVLINEVAIPFYVISALAPLLKAAADFIGKKRALLLSLIFMALGCFLCGITKNWLIFLLGNAIIAFACSADVYYLYLVDNVEENKRGTIRGIMAGIAAFATITIPLLKKILVGSGRYDYSKMYFAGIAGVVIAGIAALVFLPVDEPVIRPHKGEKNKVKFEKPGKELIIYMIILFCWGLGVSAINFYNEPIAAIVLKNEKNLNMALVIQPIITIIIMIAGGIVADRIKRKTVVFINMIIAFVGITVFALTGFLGYSNAFVIGSAWGMMIGGYFSATNLIFIIITERAKQGSVGRMSSLAAYANGAGNAIGMVLISIMSNAANLYMAKFLAFIPAGIAMLLFVRIKAYELHE